VTRRSRFSGIPGLTWCCSTDVAGSDGIDVCRQIRAESGVPIVMLTAKTDTVDVVLAGIRGRRLHHEAVQSKELVARVRARLRRTDDPAPEMLQIGDITIDVAGHSVKRNAETLNLTPLEFDLLVALAASPGRYSPARSCSSRSGLPARRGHQAGQRACTAVAGEIERIPTPRDRCHGAWCRL